PFKRMRSVPATRSVGRNFDRVLVGVVDIDRLDRADRAGARSLHPDRHAACFEMRRDLADRGFGNEADMRRHPLLAAHRGGARQIEMDLLLTEQQGCTTLADTLAPRAENALVEFEAAVDIG